jgi:hydroxypyruvate isomerase
MPRFAANISMLYTEVPFLDRFERAAADGFDAVEFLFPYAFDAADIKARLATHKLDLVLFNTPAGDWDSGERGLACNPARIDAFRSGIALALDYAKALGVPRLHCMAGTAPAGVAADVLRRTYVDNLRYAAAELKQAGLDALIEPINHYDIPGYYLNTTAQALSVIEEAGAANLLLQYDIYHAQRTEGELAATMQKHLAKIGHMQLADNPGRHEPGSGEVNYMFLFEHMDRIGYKGHVGCEYNPQAGTAAGLGWLQRARARSAAR